VNDHDFTLLENIFFPKVYSSCTDSTKHIKQMPKKTCNLSVIDAR